MRAIFERLRCNGHYWLVCGPYRIKAVRDLTPSPSHPEGFDSSQEGGRPTLPTSSSTQMLTYTFANGCVLTLRTSGTEPKLKYYAELSDSDGEDRARATLNKMVDVIVRHMLQPEDNGLAPRPTG